MFVCDGTMVHDDRRRDAEISKVQKCASLLLCFFAFCTKNLQKTHATTRPPHSALDALSHLLSFFSEFACIGNGNAYTMHTSIVLLGPAIE